MSIPSKTRPLTERLRFTVGLLAIVLGFPEDEIDSTPFAEISKYVQEELSRIDEA